MSLARAIAAVILLASLGGNALLARAVARRAATAASAQATDEAGAAVPDETAEPATPPSPQQRTAAPTAVTVPKRTPPPLAPQAGAPPAPQLGKCGLRLAVLEQDLVQKSEALRGVLPARELFGRGQPNPEAERLMAPVVAGMLASATFAGKDHKLECKDVSCKLVFTAPASADDEAWDQVLASHAEFQAWSHQFSLGPAVPIQDPATKQPLLQRTVFFKLNGPNAVAAQDSIQPGKAER